MTRRKIVARVLLALLTVCCIALAAFAQKKQIRIAAASNLQTAMPEIARAFEVQSGTHVDLVYGSSGNFYAQIQNGAPFDVFFSADTLYPQKLEESGYAELRSSVIYGLGKIVLWMRTNGPCNPERDGWKCLLNPKVKKIAIASPDHAPYGRAAVAALQRAGIYDEVKAKLVFGENISQTAQFVESGNAQAGILAYSLVLSPALQGGSKWEIPTVLYQPIEQSAVVLKSAQDKAAAQAFVKFVTEGAGRSLLEKFGFQPPDRSQGTR
jgi:molybdate transport system substrate-binding protein